MLETFNSEIIAQLKEYMKVRIGFGHKTREITRKDGTKTIINEVTLYKFELLDGAAHQPAAQPAQAAQTAAVDNQPAEAQKAADGEQKDKNDDLPF
jgi:single-stranded DNA-binding protein